MSSSDVLSSPVDASNFAYVVGIDVGSQACVYSVLQPDKRIIVKPTEVANRETGFVQLHASLSRLAVPPQRILIGLEATSRYSENLYQFLAAQGYVLWRLASAPNASVRPATRPACQDRSPGCRHDCPRPGERRGAAWLCARRADRDVSRSRALAQSTGR